MKKEKSSIATTVTHERRGKEVILSNITGNIKITGDSNQNQKRADNVGIEVTGTASVHDYLSIRGSKGTVQIEGRNAGILTPPHCDICVKVPSGTSVVLNNVGGFVTINETIGVLTISGDIPCQIFTEALHDVIMRIGSGVDVKIKRLLGRCDIIASDNAQVEVRYALISTLSATLRGTAQATFYGSARFAKFNLERQTHLHIDSVENLIERRKTRTANLSLGWVNPGRKADDEEQRRALIRQANIEMAHFISGLTTHEAVPPPLAVANA